MTRLVTQIWQDLIHGFRFMRRSLGSSVTAITVLAIGIGINAAMFSVVNKVLLEPLPFPESDRLVQLFVGSPMGRILVTSVPKFNAWRGQGAAFQNVAAFGSVEPATISIDGSVELAAAIRVSQDYFPVFGINVAMGRVLTAAEDEPAGPRAVLISHRLWQRRFATGGSGARTLVVNKEAYEIVGVVAPNAPVDSSIDVWLPLQAERSSVDHTSRVQVVARLNPHVSVSSAAQQMRDATQTFHTQFPDAMGPLEFFSAAPLRDIFVGDARATLLFLQGAVAFVLLIACANVANLLLTQGNQRQREIGIRLALGASPARVIVQLVTESALLSAIGGLAGLAMGFAGLRWLVSMHRAAFLHAGLTTTVSLDWRVLTFTLLVVVVTTLVFGLYPAVHSSRVDLTSILSSSMGQSGDTRPSHSRFRSALVIVQIACAVVLLVGAGLMIRTLLIMRKVEPGFDARGVLTLQMPVSGPRFAKTADVARLVSEAELRVATLPNVAAVAVASSLPLDPGLSLPFTIDRRPLMGAAYHGMAKWRRVSRQYFDVFRVPLLRGRTFTEYDNLQGARVAIINRAMARKFWPDGFPVQERITLSQFVRSELAEPPRIIVGIVADVRDTGLNHDPEPMIYVPVAQVGDAVNAFLNETSPLQWVVRTNVNPIPLSNAIQRELHASSGELLIGGVRTMDEIVAQSSSRADFNATLLTIFAGAALSLAALGLYGLLVHSVQQRTREFGIRMALGAAPANVRGMVLEQGLRLNLAGIAIGTVAALWLTQYMASMLYGITTSDPMVFIGVIALLTTVTLLATLASARRATAVPPMEALRHV